MKTGRKILKPNPKLSEVMKLAVSELGISDKYIIESRERKASLIRHAITGVSFELGVNNVLIAKGLHKTEATIYEYRTRCKEAEFWPDLDKLLQRLREKMR